KAFQHGYTRAQWSPFSSRTGAADHAGDLGGGPRTAAVAAGSRRSPQAVARPEPGGAAAIHVGRDDRDQPEGRSEETGAETVLIRRGRQGTEDTHPRRAGRAAAAGIGRRQTGRPFEGEGRREQGRRHEG